MALWQAGVMNSMDDAVLGEPESYGIDFELLSSVTEMDEHRNVVVPESQVQLIEKRRNDCPKEPCSRCFRG